MIDFRTAASWMRICFCWWGGKTEMIRGVQGREHEVARLGRRQRRLDRLVVAHLADENDVGVLAQGRAQRDRERLGVDLDLPLVDEALLVPVEELDGILDRHDVLGAGGVDVVDHGREGSRFTGTGGAGHQHHPAALGRDLLEDRGQQQLLRREDPDGDHTQDEAYRAPLLEDVATKSAEPRHRVRHVDLEAVLELLLLAGAHDAEGHGDAVFLHQPLLIGQGDQLAADSDHGVAPDLQVKIRGSTVGRDL